MTVEQILPVIAGDINIISTKDFSCLFSGHWTELLVELYGMPVFIVSAGVDSINIHVEEV